MAVAICVTNSRFRSAVNGMVGGIADSGGNPRSSFNCVMSASWLRASADYQEDSCDPAEQPLENESRNDIGLLEVSPHHVPWRQVVSSVEGSG